MEVFFAFVLFGAARVSGHGGRDLSIIQPVSSTGKAMNAVKRFGGPGTVSVLVVLPFLLASCTTMRHLDVKPGEDDLTGSVSPGDVVRLTTRSGERHVFRVSAVTADEISGEDRLFAFEDIEKIEVREVTTAGKTATGGAVFVGTIAFYALLFAIIGAMVAAGL